MTSIATPPADTGRRGLLSEYGVVGLLAGVGMLVMVETPSISKSLASGHTLSPRVVPYCIGGMLLVVAALLAVDIARGGRGEQETGEDVDLSHGTDWKVLAGLVALIAATGQLIPLVGFPIAGALLMFGAARLLGSRRVVLDLVVGVVVPLVGFLVFSQLLGISLPAFGGE